jgi:hypothetical protein
MDTRIFMPTLSWLNDDDMHIIPGYIPLRLIEAEAESFSTLQQSHPR